MNNLMRNLLILIFISTCLLKGVNAQSLCLAEEYTLVAGDIGKKDKNDEFKPNGKKVSLCVEKKEGPFNKVVYRYGVTGNIELEKIFSPEKPMNLNIELHGYGNGYYSTTFNFSFNLGEFQYLIIIHDGYMVGGLHSSLIVKKQTKLIADFMFFNDWDIDKRADLYDTFQKAQNKKIKSFKSAFKLSGQLDPI